MRLGKPEDVQGAVHGIRNASYFCLVALVLILYDHFLTFNVELESFWTLSFTWLRGLFFLNRYLSIILAVCAALAAFVLYGTFIIITLSSIVQFTRVYILYKPQRMVIYGLMASMLLLWSCFLCFVTIQERALIFTENWLPIIGTGCIGCRPSGKTVKGVKPWRPFIPLLIQQTILAGMILFKGFTNPARGEHAKGVMGVLMRDGAIVYLVILVSLTTCFIGATVKSIGIPLSLSNILLPVFSICTTRLLVNLRNGPHPHKHNDLFAGVEMTGLYLGGYLGGIAPARGVEGAIVTEIGNTTIIEVPVVDLADMRGGPSRCGERGDEAGGGNAHAPSECHSLRGASATVSPPLKVSALGATPGWERWGRRLPTKDFKLPTASPPDRDLFLDEGEEEDEGRRPPSDQEGGRHHQQRVQPQLHQSDRRRDSAARGSENRTSERGGSARSNTTLISNAAPLARTTPTPTTASIEIERPGTSGTERTLVRKASSYSGWPLDEAKGGQPPLKPPL